ncbi:nuclease-related domain-containing protein [Solibacillus sp. FSL H8-0538]|uniref:nuclease-related domain-containing protein n=1 Tax=Solibacillus sp. FSL H8-0538 TaxID=2921400 RepID=UPI0030F92F70
MLLLNRKKSIQHIYLQALLRRLYDLEHDYSTFQQQLMKFEAGLSGEQRVDRELLDFSIPGKHFLLQNVELLNHQTFPHQIDSILLTPNFLLILEIKNITGTLLFKPEFHEFTRVRLDGTAENFLNPFDQAYRHQLFLQQLLKQWNVHVPIKYVVVIANQNAVLDNSLKNYPIFHLSGLRLFINRLFQKYPQASLNSEMLEKVARRLLASVQRSAPNRPVDASRIRKGVLCAHCDFKELMRYQYGSWCCTKCSVRNKRAVRQAMHDYRLLISERITNKEFRDFVGIESIQIASKILMRLGFEKVGEKRGRYYIIPEEVFEE